MHEESDVRAADWRAWRRWVDECAGDLFVSHDAFEWFVRRHRAALFASGQFIPRQGRGGALVGPQIDRVVLEIMRDEAQRDLAQNSQPVTDISPESPADARVAELEAAIVEVLDNATFELFNCPRCGHAEPMADCDYVLILRSALAQNSSPVTKISPESPADT